MVKTGVFKKIAALTAAVTLVGSFAVGASAVVSIQTTTSYVAGSNNQKVSVTANVTGAGSKVEVTYYATKGAEVVYVDQDTATAAGAVKFEYVTAASDLESAVKVGYTGATSAVASDVTGYTITCGDQSTVVPTSNEGGTFTFAYAMPDGQALDKVTSTGAAVNGASYSEGYITVVLAAVTADTTLTVVTKDAVVLNPTGEYLQSAAIVSNGKTDAVEDETPGDITSEAGNRKLSVLAKVVDSDDYGIIVSETAITAGTVATLPEGAYKAKGKSAEGYFAVQLIDTADAASTDFIKANTNYYTAVYYKTASGYVIVAGGTVNAKNTK